MMDLALVPRKFIDIIFETLSKWINWNTRKEIRIGTYGSMDKDTGDVIVEGNIYDPEFQKELDKHDAGINLLADYLPRECPIEPDFVVATRRAKRLNLSEDLERNADALIKTRWEFQPEKTDAVLIMHRPRQIVIPPNAVLEPLYKVDKLVGKWLVTSKYICPAYCMYLSSKSGDKVSLALLPKEDAGAGKAGLTWWRDTDSGVLHSDVDPTGNYSFTPLYGLKRPIRRIRRHLLDGGRPDPTGDNLWYNDSPLWDPIDDDGIEDEFDPIVKSVDPFKQVEEAAAAEAAAKKVAAEAAAKAAATAGKS